MLYCKSTPLFLWDCDDDSIFTDDLIFTINTVGVSVCILMFVVTWNSQLHLIVMVVYTYKYVYDFLSVISIVSVPVL